MTLKRREMDGERRHAIGASGRRDFFQALWFAIPVLLLQVIWVAVLYAWGPWSDVSPGFKLVLIVIAILPFVLTHYLLWLLEPQVFRRWRPALASIYTYALVVFSSWCILVALYGIGYLRFLKDTWVHVITVVLLLLLGCLASRILRLLHVPHRSIGLLAAPFIAWLVLWLLSVGFIRIHWHPPGMEAKQNLHSIQLGIERYNADQCYYPEYLTGGTVNPEDLSDLLSLTDGDPLVLDGYFGDFPRVAPSSGRPEAQELPLRPVAVDIWHRMFLRYEYIVATRGDFMQLQTKFSDSYGVNYHYSRFLRKESGRALMGNLAADHRYEDGKWGFSYWLRKRGSIDLISITSQWNFYYKSLKSPGSDRPDGYILMLFGAYYDKGIDAFTTVPGGHELDGRLPDGTGIGMGVPVIPELGLEGDGKPDGVILVIHGGWPWEGGDE